jgi:hypothetical protein
VIAAALRDAVLARDDGRSVRSGELVGDWFNCHHRQLKGQGGSDAPGNRIILSGTGTMGDHGWVHNHPTLSERAGWLVKPWHNPLAAPVWLWSKGWCLLGDDLSVTPVEFGPEPEGLPS